MDFIIDRINSEIQISKPDSYDYVTFLRCRVEYILFLLAGYLWDKNRGEVLPDQIHEVVAALRKPTIGKIVSIIRILDVNNEIIRHKKRSILKLLDEYTNVRNIEIGHGYAPSDEIVPKLEPFYNSLVEQIPFLHEKYSIVVVEEKVGKKYTGIRMDWNNNGKKESWACSADIFPEQEYFPRTYFFDGKTYFLASPFVMLLNRGNDIYIFNDLFDSLSGNIKLCPLFRSGKTNYVFPEFAKLCFEEDNRKISNINQTIMNDYDYNYQHYHEIGITNLVTKFLKENRTSVAATIWGHGGVGKTACIQNVCDLLFTSELKYFSYIIFVTAKDRVYDPKRGLIIENQASFVRTYCEVISIIAQTVFNCFDDLSTSGELLHKYEQQISAIRDKVLIIIDDYETFEEEEKAKIVAFIRTLDINYHKVIITTRNKQFAIGDIFSINELDKEYSKDFALSVIKEKYPEQYNKLLAVLTQPNVIDMIKESTSGRPIFIYQFVHLLVQTGLREDLLSNLSKGKAAQDFLYGRVYNSLSREAKCVFVTIPQLSGPEMMFRMDMLKFLLEKELSSELFDRAFEELIDLKIVELVSDTRGRVYAPELVNIANESFKNQNEGFRSTIRNQLSLIGGKDISGSIPQAMLIEADQSRVNGKAEDTVRKYRHILNQNEFPAIIRKRALYNVANYLATTVMDPKASSNIMEEYIHDFMDDAEVCRRYVEYLWQQPDDDDGNNDAKYKADTFIRQYFSGPKGHKKYISPNYLFFVVGVIYCTYYDLHYRTFPSSELKYHHYSNTLNEYGGELFRRVTEHDFTTMKSTIKHYVQVALIQTIKLSLELGKTDQNKLDIAADIYRFGVANFTDSFLYQLEPLRNKLIKTAPDKDWIREHRANNSVATLDVFMERHSLGDIIEGEVVFCDIDTANVLLEGAAYGICKSEKAVLRVYRENAKAKFMIKYYSNTGKLGLSYVTADSANCKCEPE